MWMRCSVSYRPVQQEHAECLGLTTSEGQGRGIVSGAFACQLVSRRSDKGQGQPESVIDASHGCPRQAALVLAKLVLVELLNIVGYRVPGKRVGRRQLYPGRQVTARCRDPDSNYRAQALVAAVV